MPKASSFKQKRRFIIRLGKALHKFGTNSSRSEAHLQHVADFLELKAWFIITPTSLTFVFLDDDEQEHNFLVRVKPSELDLGSLARTDLLVDELVSGKRTLAEAIERLEEIAEMPNPYSRISSFIAFGASSGAFAMLMHTSWNDVFYSTILGLVVALLIFWSERSKRVTEMLEPASALICALAASAIASFDPKINVPLVVLSAIIVFIPGLSLTLGLSELAARHLIAGTARIMDAIMTLFKLYFGAFLGMSLGGLIWQPLPFEESPALAGWTAWLAVFILSLTLAVLFRLREKDTPWAIIGGFIAFGTSIWASSFLGYSLGAFAGAFALGVYSNLFSRLMNLPSSIVLLLGLVVLVPGSKVFIGLNTAISGKQMLYIPDIGSQTFLIFMSLVAGLIFSNVAVRSRKSL